MIIRNFFWLLLLSPLVSGAQSLCDVYQFSGTDSSSLKITLLIEYDEAGNIVKETYSDYRIDYKVGMADGAYNYVYQEGKKTSERYTVNGRILNESDFAYSDQGQLMQEQHFEYQPQLKRRVANQYPIGTVGPKDYKRKRKKVLTSQMHFTYDSLGRKIEAYAPNTHWEAKNRFTWTYDSTHRITSMSTYNHDELRERKTYVYNDSGYVTNTSFFKEMAADTLVDSEMPLVVKGQLIVFHTLDQDGNIVEQQAYNENGEVLYIIVSEYDERQRLMRRERFGSNLALVMTHIYRYYSLP